MYLDLTLAIVHHLLILLLAATLAAEWAVLRAPVQGPAIARLAALDAGYGASALLVLAVGALRVAYGMKGPHYYLHNPWFWTKLGAFAELGLASIPPTLAFLRWRRQQRRQPDFAVPAAQVRPLRRLLGLELVLLAAVFAAAAAMARFGLF
ncbi:DUF2214 family protein [Xanthomonas massiliensis]|uniref:DUF2214 family protein n=1 Tax=Xanthomonas massiliensis TaxID=1720302 RepID=UPI000827128C|nr:DUF2214 family protein [Xanthomonas massiliensis]